MIKEQSITKNVIYNFIKTLSTLIFPILSFSYASRVLQVSGIGNFEFSKSLVAYFIVIAMLGIVNYGTRECAKVRNDKKKLSTLAFELLCLNCCSMIISYILLFMLLIFVSKFNNYKILILINSVNLLLTVIGMEWLYNAVEDFKYITIKTCTVQIVSFIFLFLLVKQPNDIYIYAIINVASAGAGFLFNFFHARKYIDFKLVDKKNTFKHLKPVLSIFVMIISVQVFTHMDSIMLGWIIGTEAVGYYSVATKLISMLCSVIVSGTIVLMPRIAYYQNEQNDNKILLLVKKTINFILLLAIPMAFGIIVTADFCINVLSGAGFQPSILTTMILAVRVILSPLNTFIITHFFIAIGKENKIIITTIIAALINIILNSILIPLFSQNGAAISTIVAEIVELVISLIYLAKIFKLKNIFRNTWKYFVSSIWILLIYLLVNKIIENMYAKSLVVIITSTIFYFSNLYLLKDQYFFEIINKFLKIINRSRLK